MVVVPGLSCSAGHRIFLDQGSNPCLLHWQADSLALSHQGRPQALSHCRLSSLENKFTQDYMHFKCTDTERGQDTPSAPVKWTETLTSRHHRCVLLLPFSKMVLYLYPNPQLQDSLRKCLPLRKPKPAMTRERCAWLPLGFLLKVFYSNGWPVDYFILKVSYLSEWIYFSFSKTVFTFQWTRCLWIPSKRFRSEHTTLQSER